MKKLMYTITLLLGFAGWHGAQAQNKTIDSTGVEHARNLFDGVSGIMVYNIYNANDYILMLFSNNTISSELALKQASQQVSTLEYLLEQFDRELSGKGGLRNLKKNDIAYLNKLKKAVILLKNQAGYLKDYINGDSGAKAKYEVQKDLAWKQVLKVMSKE
jgi:hypothetical protein